VRQIKPAQLAFGRTIKIAYLLTYLLLRKTFCFLFCHVLIDGLNKEIVGVDNLEQYWTYISFVTMTD